jgi:hypothetical protein
VKTWFALRVSAAPADEIGQPSSSNANSPGAGWTGDDPKGEDIAWHRFPRAEATISQSAQTLQTMRTCAHPAGCKGLEAHFHDFVLPGNLPPARWPEQEAHAIAVDAYVYFYPLVTMDVTRKQFTNIEPGKAFGKGPMNMFVSVPEYPPADFKGGGSLQLRHPVLDRVGGPHENR